MTDDYGRARCKGGIQKGYNVLPKNFKIPFGREHLISENTCKVGVFSGASNKNDNNNIGGLVAGNAKTNVRQ